MKKLALLTLLSLPFIALGQSSGLSVGGEKHPKIIKTTKEGQVWSDYVFAATSNKVCIIAVRNYAALFFEDETIPQVYKDLVKEFFFKVWYTGKYNEVGKTYYLVIEKADNGIYIEDVKVSDRTDL